MANVAIKYKGYCATMTLPASSPQLGGATDIRGATVRGEGDVTYVTVFAARQDWSATIQQLVEPTLAERLVDAVRSRATRVRTNRRAIEHTITKIVNSKA